MARERLVLMRTRRVGDEPEAVAEAWSAIGQVMETLLRTLPNEGVDGGRVSAAADALINARTLMNEALFYGRVRAANAAAQKQ